MAGALLAPDDGSGEWDVPNPSPVSGVSGGQGALSARSPDAQRQLSMIDAAMMRMQQAREMRDIARAGGVNMPLLAAAGALLAPTRTGSFGESIGNAFTTAAPLIAQQRQTDATLDSRDAQQDWSMALQKAQLENAQRTREQADVRERRIAADAAAREERLLGHQKTMAELAAGRDARGRYEYKPADIPDPDNPEKKVPGYIRFDLTGREPPEPVMMGATPSQKQGASGNKSTPTILTENALEQAKAAIAKKEAESGVPLTDAEKAAINNQYIADARIAASPYSKTLNALEAQTARDIIAKDPSLADDKEAFGRLINNIKGRQILPPTKLHEVEARSRSLTDVLNSLDHMKDVLDRAVGAAGGAGRVLRPTEAIGNIIGVYGDTDLADFESQRAKVLALLPELMSYKGSGSHSKETNALLQKVLRGGNFGDTKANTESSINMLMESLVNDLKGLDGEYKGSTGSRLPMFRDIKPKQNERQTPNPAPQQPRPAPQQAPQQQAAPPKFKDGDMVRQNGVDYIYRNGDWQEVK